MNIRTTITLFILFHDAVAAGLEILKLSRLVEEANSMTDSHVRNVIIETALREMTRLDVG